MNKNNQLVSNEIQWQVKFNELCYEVFFKNKTGAQLLKHLEEKHFRMPVAFPGKEPSWAYFNEGQNEIIRSFSNAIQLHMNQPEKTVDVKTMKRGK